MIGTPQPTSYLEEELFSLLAGSVNVDQVSKLIDAGADVNAKDQLGNTPLHLVCKLKFRHYDPTYSFNFDAARLLLARGADVGAKDDDGRTPLHRVVGSNVPPNKAYLQLIRLLVEHQADVNARDNAGVTPLILAAATQHSTSHVSDDDGGIIETLLEVGADVNAQDETGRTTVHAVDLRYCDERRYWDGSRRKARQTLDDLVCLLMRRGLNTSVTDKDGYTPLHVAAKYRLPSAVALLLSQQADVNATSIDGNTPLHLVLLGLWDQWHNPHAGMVVPQARNDGWGDTSWILVGNFHNDYEEGIHIVRLLANHGADPFAVNKAGNMPVFDFMKKGRWNTVRLLLDHCKSSSVNVKDPYYGDTTLLIMVRRGEVDTVKLLLERGADMHILNGHDKSPFLTACEAGTLDMIYCLVRFSPHHLRPQPAVTRMM